MTETFLLSIVKLQLCPFHMTWFFHSEICDEIYFFLIHYSQKKKDDPEERSTGVFIFTVTVCCVGVQVAPFHSSVCAAPKKLHDDALSCLKVKINCTTSLMKSASFEVQQSFHKYFCKVHHTTLVHDIILNSYQS